MNITVEKLQLTISAGHVRTLAYIIIRSENNSCRLFDYISESFLGMAAPLEPDCFLFCLTPAGCL